jgi:hypothetical protein
VERNTAPSPDDLLTITEAAAITRQPEATLRWLRHRGEGPEGFKIGRRLFYRRSSVVGWIARQERAGSSPRPAA